MNRQVQKRRVIGRMSAVSLLTAVVLLLLSGCVQVLGMEDSDDWQVAFAARCPDEPEVPHYMTAHVKVQTCNWVTPNCGAPITGVKVAVCDKKDVLCQRPLRENIQDVNGLLEFDVPTAGSLGEGFDGYLKVSSEAALCTDAAVFGSAALCRLVPDCETSAPDERCMLPKIQPAMYFFNPPILQDTTRPLVLPLAPTSAIPPILEAAGVTTLDPTLGIAFLMAVDCAGKTLPGAVFGLSRDQERATPVYVDRGIVTRNAAMTDASGIGGFLGVPTGFVRVSTTRTGGPLAGSHLRYGEVGVQIAPFTVSIVPLVQQL